MNKHIFALGEFKQKIEEIRVMPVIIDTLLDDAITDITRQGIKIKLREICHLAIQTLESPLIPENATNGDVMRKIFSKTRFYDGYTYKYTENDKVLIDLEWWNAPYRERDEE